MNIHPVIHSVDVGLKKEAEGTPTIKQVGVPQSVEKVTLRSGFFALNVV